MAKRAGVITVDIQAGTTKFTEDINTAKARIQDFGKSGASAMAPTSAALRELEGNFGNNTRAVSRFLAQTLNLGPVLQAAFPIVGGLAFGGMIVDLGKKVYQFFNDLSEAPKKTKIAFDELASQARTTNDELRVTGDRLEVDIAKLEGKRPNLLKLALDEAAKSADALARSLEKDVGELEKLLKEHKTGWFGENILGKAGTEDLEKINKKLQEDLHSADEKRRTGIRQARGVSDPAQAKSIEDAAIKAYSDTARALYKGVEAKLTEIINAKPKVEGQGTIFQQDVDPSRRANILAAANGMRQDVQDRIDQIGEEHRVATDQSRKDQLEADKAASEAAKKAAEERKHQLDALRRFTKELDHYITENNLTIQSPNGPINFRSKTEDHRLDEENDRVMQEYGKGIEEHLKEMFKEDKFDAGRLPFLKTAPYKPNGLPNYETLDEQKARLEHQGRMSNIGVYDPAEKAKKELDARLNVIEEIRKREVDALTDQFKIQQANNKADLEAAQARYSYEEHIAEIKQSERDKILNPLISGVSDQLASAATGKKTNFAGTFQQLGHSVIQNQFEKMFHGLLGGGKADGTSKDKALWTKSADSLPGLPGGSSSPTSGLGGLLGKIFHPSSASAAGDASGGVWDEAPAMLKKLGGFGSIFSKFGGFMAEGGAVDPTSTYIVGEREPEFFSPRSSGSITPMSKMSMGGSSVNYTIDARGAALGVENRIGRSIEMAHQSAIANSVLANKQKQDRTPQRSK